MNNLIDKVGDGVGVEYGNIVKEIEVVTGKVEDTMKSLQNLLNSISKRTAELEAHEKRVVDMDALLKINRDKVASIVKLNLRGKLFITYKSTLIKVGGTYFFAMLSSSVWQPDLEGAYFIDRYHEGFERILEYLSTGVLSFKGLNEYEIDCVYSNLDYFNIPHKRRCDFNDVEKLTESDNYFTNQLQDGRLCGINGNNSDIVIFNANTCAFEITLSGHTDAICDIIELEDGRLCSCSFDTTIRIWNVESGLCVLTLVDGVNYVIQLMDGRLCSWSYDYSMKVWNVETGECELSIVTYGKVWCLAQLTDGRVCSGHSGGDIKVWDLSTGLTEMSFVGHDDDVNDIVVVDDTKICSCSDDKTIKVWNTDGVCERTFEGHKDSVLEMSLFEDGRLCSVSRDSIIKLWNIEKGVCVQTIKVPEMPDACYRPFQLNDGRLLHASFVWK